MNKRILSFLTVLAIAVLCADVQAQLRPLRFARPGRIIGVPGLRLGAFRGIRNRRAVVSDTQFGTIQSSQYVPYTPVTNIVPGGAPIISQPTYVQPAYESSYLQPTYMAPSQSVVVQPLNIQPSFAQPAYLQPTMMESFIQPAQIEAQATLPSFAAPPTLESAASMPLVSAEQTQTIYSNPNANDVANSVLSQRTDQMIRLTYESTATSPLKFWLNGSELFLQPGETLAMDDTQQWDFGFAPGNGQTPVSMKFDKRGNYIATLTAAGIEINKLDSQVEPNIAPGVITEPPTDVAESAPEFEPVDDSSKTELDTLPVEEMNEPGQVDSLPLENPKESDETEIDSLPLENPKESDETEIDSLPPEPTDDSGASEVESLPEDSNEELDIEDSFNDPTDDGS